MIRALGRLNPLNAPIAAQIVAMLVVGLLVGQALIFVVIVLLPPPPQPVFRTEEVAEALRGQTVRSREGRALDGRIQTDPPARGPDDAWTASLRRDIARDLKLAADRIRLRIDQGPGRPFEPRPHPPPRDRAGPAEPRPDRPGGPPALIFGRFEAAVQTPTGAWRVVSPRPDPFFGGWRGDLLAWFLACAAVLGPIGYLFARRLTAPIRRFAEAAETLGRDPGGPTLELQGPAEIGVAARAFNRMQDRLRRYVEDRTTFIAAISHDLRTPLARMRFKLEKAPPEIRRAVGEDVEQMEQMVQAVLALVRDGTQGGPRTRLDLLSLLECVVDDATFAGASVLIAEAEATEIDGDTVALRSVFANLIENGVKYGQTVRVALRRESADAVVEIADCGPGLSPQDLERVFAPFYRAEPSRNRGTGGIGLGLTVARTIARAHGGDVTLAQGSERGLVATVRLPLERVR